MLALEAAMVLILTGCVPIPPRPVPVSAVPTILGNSFCNATFVRKKQFAGSAPSHYISLDKLTVAALEVGEYTTFAISEGHHSLAITWRVADTPGVFTLHWSPYTKTVDLDCKPPANHFFTITSAFSWNENDRVEVKKVEQLDGDFALERNKFVTPGPR